MLQKPSVEIESTIASMEKQRDILKARLDGLLQRLQNELPAAAEGWIRREVERQISDHPETVNNLGISKLKLLKERMNALIASLPDLAKREMADTKQWPQNFAGINDMYFDDVFRRLISSLGLLLAQFGLLQSPEGRYQSWQASGPDNFRYSINTGSTSFLYRRVTNFTKHTRSLRSLPMHSARSKRNS